MVFRKFFYSIVLCILFIGNSTLTTEATFDGCEGYIQTLDKIASKALDWYDIYMSPLSSSEQVEFYNGLLDLSEFTFRTILHEKYSINSLQLIVMLKKASIEDEEDILRMLCYTSQAALKNYPAKTEYERRVQSFYQRCQEHESYKKALDCFFDDLKNFISKESGIFFLGQLENTKVVLSEFIEEIITMQRKVNAEGFITKSKYEEQMLPCYYDSLKLISDDICALIIKTSEIQEVLNKTILIYTDSIIKNINL